MCAEVEAVEQSGLGGEWQSRLEKFRVGVIGKRLGWKVKKFGFHAVLKITFYYYKYKHIIKIR